MVFLRSRYYFSEEERKELESMYKNYKKLKMGIYFGKTGNCKGQLGEAYFFLVEKMDDEHKLHVGTYTTKPFLENNIRYNFVQNAKRILKSKGYVRDMLYHYHENGEPLTFYQEKGNDIRKY